MGFLSIRSKSANSQTFYNVLSTIIRTGISFFTIPLFTKLLGTEQYGLYSIYLSWYNVINCLIALGCGQGVATGMIQFKSDYYRFRSSILFGGICMCAVSTTIGILIFPLLNVHLNYPFLIYLLLYLESVGNFVIGFAGVVWTYEKKAAQNMCLSLATLLLTTGASWFLIIKWWNGQSTLYMARVFGVAFPTIFIGAIVFAILFLKKPALFVKKYWIYSFSFGIPMIFHTLSNHVLASSDRIMMNYFKISEGEIGVYSFFYSFVSLISYILTALNNSWIPFLYEDLEKKEYDKINGRIKNYVQIFTIITCGFLMLSREVSRLFSTKEFEWGTNIIPFIVVAMYCIFIYQFPVNYEFFKAKPRIIACATAFSAVLNIVLNILMIPSCGMYGAALATLISYAILDVIHFVVVEKWKEEKYPLIKYPLLIGLIMVLVFCLIYYVISDLWLLRWGIGIVLGAYLVYSVYKRRTIF